MCQNKTVWFDYFQNLVGVNDFSLPRLWYETLPPSGRYFIFKLTFSPTGVIFAEKIAFCSFIRELWRTWTSTWARWLDWYFSWRRWRRSHGSCAQRSAASPTRASAATSPPPSSSTARDSGDGCIWQRLRSRRTSGSYRPRNPLF